MGIVVYLACLVIAWLNPADAVKCLQCVDMPHPFDCNLITECSSAELCFVEQFITSSGLALYNSGCRSKQRCSAVKREIGQPMKRQDELLSKQDLVTCIECCQGEFCNTGGCNDLAPPRATRGPKCFDCKNQLAPGKCRDTITCDIGEVCALEKNPVNYKEWTSKCSQKLQCERLVQMQAAGIIGKRDTVTVKKCPRCCIDDYCNDDCFHNVTYIATKPTTTPPTTPTTTPAKPTTTKLQSATTNPGHGTTVNPSNTAVNTSGHGNHHTNTTTTQKPSNNGSHHGVQTTRHPHSYINTTTASQTVTTTKQAGHHNHHNNKTTTASTTNKHHSTAKLTTTHAGHNHHHNKITTVSTTKKHHSTAKLTTTHQTTPKPTVKHTTPPAHTSPITTPHLVTTPNPAIMCKNQGYIYDDPTRLCLKFYTTPKYNWTEAQGECQKHNGRLVVVTTPLKKRDVKHYLSTKSEYHGIKFWVGATEISHVHTFTWTDGKVVVVDDYKNYDLTKTNCLLTGSPEPSIVYDPCPEKNAFICENSNYIRT